jgi:carboxyl-terminal processing protease
MMMSDKRLKLVYLPIIVSLSIIIGLFAGRYFNFSGTNGKLLVYPPNQKLSGIINVISKEYVDKVSKEELVEKTIPKILEELDPHSVYIPASELQQVNEPLEGNFSGIGIQFNMLNDTLIVLQTIANGPSEKVGIVAGDRIIVVDGDTMAGKKIPSDSLVKRLKGPKGTNVEIGVKRNNVDKLIYFDITRDEIPLYSVDVAYMVTPEIGFMKISKFSLTTYREFTQKIVDLKSKGMKKLIIDLRGNGGGYLEDAINIIDEFLPDHELILYTEGNAQKRIDYTSNNGGLCTDIEVAVLIDEGSASASEIVAGALQDNDRGIIIGRRSFGKGLVQRQINLADGSALRLTIARYYTPTGRSIQRPYNHGSEEYYSDLTHRFSNGEVYHLDSTQFADSLKFTTPGGKTVYGGGGITPDVFVPLDTVNVTDYLLAVRNHGLVYRFALEYTDNHREQLSKFSGWKEMRNYLKKQPVLEQFTAFAEKNGIPKNPEQIQTSRYILETQLQAFIIRNMFDNDGFYPVIQDIDNTLEVALEKLKD